MRKSVLWRTILASLGLVLILPALVLAGNLLTNGVFNEFSKIPGRSWRGYDEKVGTGWTHFYVESGTELNKLHWLSSSDFTAAFNPGGDPYELEGQNGSAQNMWSAYEFDAGIYQRVTGLTPGTAYAFDVPVVTFWRGPGYPDSDGVMHKWVGIDPTGGTDPTSSSVIWSDVDSDDKKWVYMELAARAESEAMTFFVRIRAPENTSYNHTDLDMVYIDAAKVDLAPTVNLSVPAPSDTNVSFSWTSSAAPGWAIKGVEIQYRNAVNDEWHIVQGKTGDGNASAAFTGQPGHTYIVRARAWQTRAEAYNGDIDMPGLWVEESVTVGGAFAGFVRTNFGVGISGALVSTSDSSATSGGGGFYALEPLEYGRDYELTASASNYVSPPSIPGMVSDATSVTTIDLTLKPGNDAIDNGDFESSISGWNLGGTGSGAINSDEFHSGGSSLRLIGPITLSQAVVTSETRNPTLSFWYKPTLSKDDSFGVSLGGSIGSVSKTLTEEAEWQHVWLPLNQPDPYSGTLTVSFQLSGGEVLLDEVSLGDGAHTVFFPLIYRATMP
jgi:hypothetical protein